MRVAKYLPRKVAFALQFRLVSVQSGDIEHEAANLHQTAQIVIHAKSVDQDIDGRAVFAAKRSFKIPHVTIFFKGLAVEQPLLGSGIDLSRNIYLKKFIAAGVSQHRHQGVVDFDKSAFGSTEEKSLLNIVEQFAIAALGLAAVGDVFQDVDRLQTFAGDTVNSRSGNQISAVERGMNVFVRVIPHGPAKRARVKGRFSGQSQERPHVNAD